jgi:hypothetical protein
VASFTKNTIKRDIIRIFTREKMKLKEEMKIIPSRICLTLDLWTSIKTEGYMTFIAHYVDLSWKL